MHRQCTDVLFSRNQNEEILIFTFLLETFCMCRVTIRVTSWQLCNRWESWKYCPTKAKNSSCFFFKRAVTAVCICRYMHGPRRGSSLAQRTRTLRQRWATFCRPSDGGEPGDFLRGVRCVTLRCRDGVAPVVTHGHIYIEAARPRITALCTFF